MTVKEYLKQGTRLDRRVRATLLELAQLRQTAADLSAAADTEGGCAGKASLTRAQGRIADLEQRLSTEVDLLAELKGQIRCVIDRVPDPDERMVLRFRYILNLSWEQIGDELHYSKSTLHRRHASALRHAVLPADAIVI